VKQCVTKPTPFTASRKLKLVNVISSNKLEGPALKLYLEKAKATKAKTALRKQLAEYAHDAWSSWMRYLWEKSLHTETGEVIIPVDSVKRWERQMNTVYVDLPEEEQTSDLKEADQMLKIITQHCKL